MQYTNEATHFSYGKSCRTRSLLPLLLVIVVAMQPTMRQVGGVETERNEQESIKLISASSYVCVSTSSTFNPQKRNRSHSIQRLTNHTAFIMIPKSLLTIFLSLQSLDQPARDSFNEYDVKVINHISHTMNTDYGQVSLVNPQEKEVVIQSQTKYPVSLPC